MQTGVEYKMQLNPKDTEPKHLRVGINVAQRDLSSMVELLIAKGIITLEEYTKAIADGMQKEVDSYQKLLANQFDWSMRWMRFTRSTLGSDSFSSKEK
jgi:hypothetical protein